MASGSQPGPDLQRAQTFFQYGNDAALKNNLDYAIDMFRQCCKIVPNHLPFRNALRTVERKKFANDPAKVGMMASARLQPIKARLKTAKVRKQWTNVLEICEEAFVQSPWDISTAEDAADAAQELEFPQLAEWFLESVSRQGTDNLGYLRHSAQIYERNESWHKAIHCWERIKQLRPHDEEAGRQMRSLSASHTIMKSGLGEAIDKSSAAAAAEANKPDLDELKPTPQTIEQKYFQEIRDQPTRPGPYLRFSEYLRHQDRLDDAEKILSKARQMIPDDGVIQTEYAELQLSRLRKAISEWERHYKQHPEDADARGRLERLRAKLNEYEADEFRRRLAIKPDDQNLRLELGRRLAVAGKHNEAIAEFQQARSSPEHQVKALLYAGRSFEANNILKLAERNYNDALKVLETAAPDDKATFNELHYLLGRIAETQGNLDQAEEHYNEVAANDYSYRDVAQRLQNLNQAPPS